MLGQATITSRAGLPVGLAYNPISAAQSEVRKHTLLCHTPAHNQCASVASLCFQNKGQSPAITYRARTWSDPPLLASLPPYSPSPLWLLRSSLSLSSSPLLYLRPVTQMPPSASNARAALPLVGVCSASPGRPEAPLLPVPHIKAFWFPLPQHGPSP